MFIGQYEHNLDGKHRLNIPSTFRETIETSDEPKLLYVTLGLDACLFLFTKSQWLEVTATLKQKVFTQRAARDFMRFFYSNAKDVELDGQGRILIPVHLRAEARITKKVTIIGVGDRIEVWDRDRWNARKETAGSQYETLAEGLF